MKNIKESEMNFGNFDEKNLFEIENSSLLKKLGAGIKTVEFILLKSGNSIIFLEAKKTCPNEKNMRETSKKEEKFEQYYNSIVEKFTDSLQVYLAAVFHRCDIYPEEIGEHLIKTDNFHAKEICFVLVIKEADTSWLAGPKAILENRLLALRKIWDIRILVLNYELAKKYNLISDT